VRALAPTFTPYEWAPSTAELARRTGLDPLEIVRFDANVPARPPPSARPATLAAALADVNTYPHGGYPALLAAIARYCGVEPANVVLGAGADDLILLSARAFAGPGDRVAITPEPTYPLYRVAAALAGAEVDSDPEPALTFSCRPNNPSGELGPLPEARPLVVDEAYFEYAGESAVGLLEDGVVVLRTFSKAFGLAGARVGYALANAETAAELSRLQAPLAVSSLSAALAAAALVDPPDVGPQLEERERLAGALGELGLRPLPSRTNFLFVPLSEAHVVAGSLLRSGVVVRVFADGIRVSVRDREDDDLFLRALAQALDRPSPPVRGGRSVRHLRATGETRIRVRLALDGGGRVRVATGAGLYDHLLEQLAFHGGLDLVLDGVGDLETGPHHTAEDAAIALGEALDRALADRAGVTRYGSAVVPMDDALARAAVDLGGRAWAELRLARDPGLASHALRSFAAAARIGLHVESDGQDEHHVAEAAYKAVGRALRDALRVEGAGIPSTKGRL
jgi:histidinol-phosphate/aromatic aminotransferase/cobyric acid decarboxylase-like protein/imidazoleglycerol phosphate dehydratase HisB